jgi:hypothetical protein
VAAQDAHQRHPSVLEVEERVVTAEAAQELSRAIRESPCGLCKADWPLLCRVRNHCRDPLSREVVRLSYIATLSRVTALVSYKSGATRNRPFFEEVNRQVQECQYAHQQSAEIVAIWWE